MDIDTVKVKVFVEAYPEALLDLRLYLPLESEPSSVRLRNRWDATLLDVVACKKKGTTFGLFQLLYCMARAEALYG